MGFFSNLGKALVGQPISDNTSPTVAGSQNNIVGQQGPKIIPPIELNNIRSHRQGDRLIVTAWVMNDSDQQIRIDSCHLLKQKRQFNQVLGPNQSHELTLYEGPAPRDENEHDAQVIYRLQSTGDSFQNSYRIVYHLESDGTRTVDNLQNDGPTRDI